MMSVARTFRQKLPCNLKAISKFSQTAVKTPAANIHTVKLLELHDTLHAAKEPELQFRGLRIPGFPTSPATSPPRIALHITGRVMNETPTTFCSMYTSAITSAAGAAKQSISAMISDSAQTQINRIRESHGRFQNKYLYGNPKPSPKPASCEKSSRVESKTTPTSAAVSELKKDVATSVFGNKVKKAQRSLSKEDLANAFDL
ncbi:hypothetical protein IFR04_009217 [Cadophora malorum]|uniref:Uncharacterized protein n=1 Tax=Cadophora malorum TaxID=108018 RepID=A0A8H7TEC7_9HELO|nr:hypothetical protein IFR04_009217 [Cadophora malorum]